MRKKFKIMHTYDHQKFELRGKQYHPPAGKMVLMNSTGVFYLFDDTGEKPVIANLSDVLPKYDVIWKKQ